MSRTRTVRDSVVIAVEPRTAYDAVSDVRQMGRWSPENTGASVRADRSSPAHVGQAFVGSNRRGPARWSTRCTVTVAEPGREFTFMVHRIGIAIPLLPSPIATWSYLFEPVGAGTRVTEVWTDDRPWPDLVATAFDRLVTGGTTFADFQRGNIRRTLTNLKRQLEVG